MALSTQPYKGARDFYPEDKRLQKYMFRIIRETVEKFGYEEYDAPLLEPLEIYMAKTGDEIVNDQTYAFEDRSGRKVAVRPEMTPSVSRMVAARRQELSYPLRLYNIGSRWRYERPQRGRNREFFQLDVDIFGVEGLDADKEIIQVADAVLKEFGAETSSYQIKVNSRKAVSELLERLGFSEDSVPKVIGLFDRVGKESFKAYLENNFTTEEGALLNGFLEETSSEDILKTNAGHNLAKLVEELKSVGIAVEVDLKVNRGFAYYTDIVFEVFDADPDNNRSMFGGGRYDGLVGLFGVEPISSVGFAMGDVTLQNFLEAKQLIPQLPSETDLYIALLNIPYEQVQTILSQLRAGGVNVAVDTTGRKIGKQLQVASKKGLNYCLIIGEDELKSGKFTLRNMQSSSEEKISLDDIVNKFAK